FVPDGDWLLRIQPSFRFGADPGPMWQQVVHVHGDAVDLGDLAPPARVTATLHWSWPARDTTVRTVVGVWLHSAYGGDHAALWAGTHHATTEGATLHNVPPGRYEVVPFGCFDEHAWVMLGSHGITGTPLARPCRIEIEASGAVVPTELELQPLPPPEPR
ncbi:MAG TPA: hypothetical protein VFZ65_13905, partial [Planctomycetota bacterium]|nr:hypothetical protein [Planctomycetota bacterium]